MEAARFYGGESDVELVIGLIVLAKGFGLADMGRDGREGMGG